MSYRRWNCTPWGRSYRHVYFRRCYFARRLYAAAQVFRAPGGWVARVSHIGDRELKTSGILPSRAVAQRWANADLRHAGSML